MPKRESDHENGKIFNLFPYEIQDSVEIDSIIDKEQAVGEVTKLREQQPHLGSLLCLILASDMPNDSVSHLIEDIANGNVDTGLVKQKLLDNVRINSKHKTSKPIG